MKRLKISIDTIIFSGVIGIIGLVIGVYCFFSHNQQISMDTSDWGSFGGYFGGMLSLVSVILLYYALKEQRKENHRNWFDAGFMRRIQALCKFIEQNQILIRGLSESILKSYEEERKYSIFDDNIDKGDAKTTISNHYINSTIDCKAITEVLYFQFIRTFEYINADKQFDDKQIAIYTCELEHSLSLESIVLIISNMCYQNDDNTINQLAKRHAFYDFQTEQPGFNILKYALFYNRNLPKLFKDKTEIWKYCSRRRIIFRNDYRFYEGGEILHYSGIVIQHTNIKYVSSAQISDAEKEKILLKCKEECPEEMVKQIKSILSANN